MPSNPEVEHVDRKELYTSLPARIQYLHSFLDFNSADIDALQLGSRYIKSLIPAVVNIVYRKLLSYDITAQTFTTRSTSYVGPLSSTPLPSIDSPQIRYRKMFLRGYLQKLCSDPTKFEFWEYLDKVGMMHVGQGRKHPLHVEYVHIGMCLGFIQDVVVEAILNHPKLRLDQKTQIVKAMGKILWIQNDLFAKWYVRDGDEFAEEMKEREVEREGWVNGKKVIAEEESDEGDDTEKESSTGGCPFASMVRDMNAEMPKDHPKVPGSQIPRPAKVNGKE